MQQKQSEIYASLFSFAILNFWLGLSFLQINYVSTVHCACILADVQVYVSIH